MASAGGDLLIVADNDGSIDNTQRLTISLASRECQQIVRPIAAAMEKKATLVIRPRINTAAFTNRSLKPGGRGTTRIDDSRARTPGEKSDSSRIASVRWSTPSSAVCGSYIISRERISRAFPRHARRRSAPSPSRAPRSASRTSSPRGKYSGCRHDRAPRRPTHRPPPASGSRRLDFLKTDSPQSCFPYMAG